MHYFHARFLSEETKAPRDRATAWGHTGSEELCQGLALGLKTQSPAHVQ